MGTSCRPRAVFASAISGALAAMFAMTMTVMPKVAHAQGGARSIDWRGTWTWSELRAQPGVDTAAVDWLQAHVPMSEAHSLFGTIAQLSQPEAAQLVPSLFYLDETARLSALSRAYADSFAARPPAGVPGMVRVAFLAARLRHTILDGYRTRGVMALDFPSPAELEARFAAARRFTPAVLATWKPAARDEASRKVDLKLSFSFAPADTILAILDTPDISAQSAERRVASSDFAALVVHHNQSFYPMPLTVEELGLNLAHAASTQPLDLLYMYAEPLALFHYADVRQHRAEYHQLMSLLHANESALTTAAMSALAPYTPRGTRLARTVTFFFASGADGWGSGNVAGVELEYFKGDIERLMNVITHETYHAIQIAVQASQPQRPAPRQSPAEQFLVAGLNQLWVEGTANYIAPATNRTPDDALAVARKGASIIGELYQATAVQFDRARAQDALNRGTAGGGPFYWLGAEMSKTIVDAFGAEALANTLKGDPIGFFETYLKAVGARHEQQTFFSPELIAAVKRIPR